MWQIAVLICLAGVIVYLFYFALSFRKNNNVLSILFFFAGLFFIALTISVSANLTEEEWTTFDGSINITRNLTAKNGSFDNIFTGTINSSSTFYGTDIDIFGNITTSGNGSFNYVFGNATYLDGVLISDNFDWADIMNITNFDWEDIMNISNFDWDDVMNQSNFDFNDFWNLSENETSAKVVNLTADSLMANYLYGDGSKLSNLPDYYVNASGDNMSGNLTLDDESVMIRDSSGNIRTFFEDEIFIVEG